MNCNSNSRHRTQHQMNSIATTDIPHGLTWALLLGWVASVIIGITVGSFMDRRRFLHGLRAQVAMIREDIELASDKEWRDRSAPNSIDTVWTRSLPEIRKTIFLALPHLMFPHESDRLIAYWVSLRDLRHEGFYEAGSTEELLDRHLDGIATVTQKQGILTTLNRLEAYIR